MIITRSNSVAEYKADALNALDRMRDIFFAIAAGATTNTFIGLAPVPERSETFFCFTVTADCLSMISFLLKWAFILAHLAKTGSRIYVKY
jgi:hypothetical protein